MSDNQQYYYNNKSELTELKHAGIRNGTHSGKCGTTQQKFNRNSEVGHIKIK